MVFNTETTLCQTFLFITAHIAYASTNKIKIVSVETELFSLSLSLYPWRTRLMFTCVFGRCAAYSLISTQTFRKAPTASVDSCAEIKIAPSVVKPAPREF